LSGKALYETKPGSITKKGDTMNQSEISIFQRIRRYFKSKRAIQQHEALKQLEAAIAMPRVDGRIEAIRVAWEGYVKTRKP